MIGVIVDLSSYNINYILHSKGIQRNLTISKLLLWSILEEEISSYWNLDGLRYAVGAKNFLSFRTTIFEKGGCIGAREV